MSGSSALGAPNNIAGLITEYSVLVQREERVPLGGAQFVTLAKVINNKGQLTVRVKINLQEHPLLKKDYINGTAQLMSKVKKIVDGTTEYLRTRNIAAKVIIHELDVSRTEVRGRAFFSTPDHSLLASIRVLNLVHSKITIYNGFFENLHHFQQLKKLDLTDSLAQNMPVLTSICHPTLREIHTTSTTLVRSQLHSEARLPPLSSYSESPVASSSMDLPTSPRGVPEILKPVALKNLDIELPFAPLYRLHIRNPEEYQRFKKSWTDLVKDQSCKIYFDDKEYVYFGYNGEELEKLAYRSSELKEFIVAAEGKTLFNGYWPWGWIMEGGRDNPDLYVACKDFFVGFQGTPLTTPLRYSDPLSCIQEIFNHDNYEGMIVGEGHTSIKSKKLIMDNIDLLKAQGVASLFLEFLCYDTMQDELDRYFLSQCSEMPIIVESRLRSLDNFFYIPDKAYGYESLVKAMKLAGIRVVAMETSSSQNSGIGSYSFNPFLRVAHMNFIAYTVIQLEKKGGKFVVLTGGKHAVDLQTPDDHYPNYGLSTLLGCPSVSTDTCPRSDLQKFQYQLCEGVALDSLKWTSVPKE